MDFLFNSLPMACGFPSLDPGNTDVNKTAGFIAVLAEALCELRDAYPRMIYNFPKIIAQTLFPDINDKLELSALRSKVKLRYGYLVKRTVDVKGLRPFIEHLAEEKSSDDIWLQSLFLFLGGRVPQKWTDNEEDAALLKLSEFLKRCLDLAVRQKHVNEHAQFNDDYDVIQIQIMRLGHLDHEAIVPIDKACKEYITPYKEKAVSILAKIDDDEIRTYILASLVEDCLIEEEISANG
jgi:hypothetical protein